jgi:hypothetical protein
MVTDWSHRHVLFSRPTSWLTSWKLQGEPRAAGSKPFAVPDWVRHPSSRQRDDSCEVTRDVGRDIAGDESEREFGRGGDSDFGPRWGHGGWPRHERLDSFHKDWAQSLGAGGSTGVPFVSPTWNPVFPAKFTFDVSADPDCTNDFVVFPTNLEGSAPRPASSLTTSSIQAQERRSATPQTLLSIGHTTRMSTQQAQPPPELSQALQGPATAASWHSLKSDPSFAEMARLRREGDTVRFELNPIRPAPSAGT